MQDKLVGYPFVVVRVGCDLCTRKGAYRLARLAAKFGPEISLPELLARLTFDCAFRHPRHPGQGQCRARFIDLDPPMRPPDNPAVGLRLIAGGKS
jgi:hypothetical protein